MATLSSDPNSFARLIEQIKKDQKSGANELTTKAIIALKVANRTVGLRDMKAYKKSMVRVARGLSAAQPSMAPILNLCNRVQEILIHADRVQDLKTEIDELLRETQQNQQVSKKRITQHVFELLPYRCSILTYSRSSTVQEALLYTRRSGKRIRVVCSESRPKNEGIQLAERLAYGGINTTLVLDAALFDFAGKVDMIIIGADTITLDGVINKIGTRGLAMVAQANSVPFYCLCSEDKLLRPSVAEQFQVERKSPQDIYHKRTKNLSVMNYYFDVTPFDYVSKIITEAGPLTPNAIKEKLKTRG